MNVKIDTKEIFHVITINESILSANMAEELKDACLNANKDSSMSLVINFEHVGEMDHAIAVALQELHEKQYMHKKSFVICGINNTIKSTFQENDIFETLNITPTESEAWDIVQMEEIERELDLDI